MYKKYVKRCLDFTLSLMAMIVLSPVLLIVAIIVKIKLGSPVLFTQERPGKGKKIFKLYKFRTMMDQRDKDGKLLPDEVRLTKFGRILRSTSLDELPELFNILKGDMSIIGPRPLLVEYLPYYTEREELRHTVRPGLSGLAQVSGRNYLNWDNRLAKDVEYVENISFTFDMKIIMMTIMQIVKKQDVAVDTNKVEPNFAEERRRKL